MAVRKRSKSKKKTRTSRQPRVQVETQRLSDLIQTSEVRFVNNDFRSVFGPLVSDTDQLTANQYERYRSLRERDELARRRAEEERNRREYERLAQSSRVYTDYDRFGPSPRLSTRIDFDIDAIARASHQEIFKVSVEKISNEVVKAASERIASKLVDQLAAKFEGEILASVKELANELSRNMENRGTADSGVSQRIEGSEDFPRLA